MTEKRRSGSIRLFRFAGVEVFLHWSWLVLAVFEITKRRAMYSSLVWNVAEYLVLFGIVLLHEFGHSLACKQVGGRADKILLWPLGGVAFVSPPFRPGAILWSIAAGPLVNVLLLIVYIVALPFVPYGGWSHDAQHLLLAVWYINLVLLIFNMLPIYPLDGGQILRALLWFVIGPSKSLLATSILGMAGAAALGAFAAYHGAIWLGIMAAFIFFGSVRGYQGARMLSRRESGEAF